MVRRHFQLQYHLSKRRIAYIALFALLSYWVFIKQKRYIKSYQLTLQNDDESNTKIIWEYMADFSNHAKLNPTITNFEIVHEKGNYENWEYGVNYEQTSLGFPYLHFRNYALIKILPEITDKQKKKVNSQLHSVYEPAKIISNVNMCSLGFCCKSGSEMTFTSIQHGFSKRQPKFSTKIFETFHFDCSLFLSHLFFPEIQRQKELIYQNIENSGIDFSVPN